MESILPKFVSHIFIHDPHQEDQNVICIGLEDIRTGEIFDHQIFRSASQLNADKVRSFLNTYKRILKYNGVI